MKSLLVLCLSLGIGLLPFSSFAETNQAETTQEVAPLSLQDPAKAQSITFLKEQVNAGLNQTGFEKGAALEVFPSYKVDMKHEFLNKTSIKRSKILGAIQKLIDDPNFQASFDINKGLTIENIPYSSLLQPLIADFMRIEHKNHLRAILNNSVFNKEPQSLPTLNVSSYDPNLLTVVSAMYSSLPERDDTKWQQINLLPSAKGYPHSPCPNTMRAFVKYSKQEDPYTFVILPGAYSSWESGFFTNQTIDLLNKIFKDPNIIAFDGYLTPAFLQDTCNQIPWNVQALAEDIRERLKNILRSVRFNGKSEKTGLIGYSGGASLVLAMLAKDSDEVSELGYDQLRLFGLGGTAFSPALHALSVYDNLDRSVAKIQHEKALTSMDLSHIMFMGGAFLKDFSLDFWDIVALYENDPENFRERFFNEFTVQELKATLSAINLTVQELKATLSDIHEDPKVYGRELSYYNVYVRIGFQIDNAFSGLKKVFLDEEELRDSFDRVMDPRPVLKKVDRPLLIYFSQDDPVLSSYDNSGQPPAISGILRSARENPYITVFNPEYGAHTGNFLDPIFEYLMSAFFKPPTSSLTLKNIELFLQDIENLSADTSH